MSDPNMIKQAKVVKNDDDSGNAPLNQMTYMDKVADVPQYMPYGLTSRPPKDSLAAIFNLQGQEQNRLAFVFNWFKRKKKLKEGETVLENMLSGGFIYMKEDGDMEINIPKDLVENVKNITINGQDATLNLNVATVNATTININANVNINGTFKVNGVDVGEAHRHSGVQSGPSNSGGVVP